ncbi:hypothetical protein BV20DRAFT_1116676 [Pilatotrama ljubarskyi]|nr:hypothetical protein BV20DRAFT_1116676 [Pilatotrama ljubarskyi]
MAMEVPAAPPLPKLDDTFGAFLIGTLVAVMLYGVTVHQTYQYVRTYPEDPRANRLLVTALFYFYLVSNYNNPRALLRGTWSIDLLTLISGVIIILSQSYFARRVYLIGGGVFRLLVLLADSLLLQPYKRRDYPSFVAERKLTVFISFAFPVFTHFQKSTWLISAGAAMAAAADTLLASVLVVVLQRNATGMKRYVPQISVMSLTRPSYLSVSLGTVVEILILYAISTGLLTSLVNLLFLIFSLLYCSNLIYTAFGIVCTKLYANSLLAALNARKYLAERAIGPMPCNTSIDLRASTRVLAISMVQPSPTFTLQERLQYREAPLASPLSPTPIRTSSAHPSQAPEV